MQPDIRRMIAVGAHRRKSGVCPRVIHSLGTGESFVIEPVPDGFIDVHSGMRAHCEDNRLVLPDSSASIDICFSGDVLFSGFEPVSQETFYGRAGGGASVTVYDGQMENFFQFAVAGEVIADN